MFLIQGRGRRRWRIGQHCDENTSLRPHQELKLLAEFEEKAMYDLEPGDILYVPPGVAHDGVALDDDCMTLSIGFRAPSRAELVTGWSDHVLDHLTEDDRYGDAGLAPQANPGEITAEALDRLQAMVLEALGDRDQFARWFGASSSTRKYPEIDWAPEEPLAADDVREALAEGSPVLRNPASRFAFSQNGEGVLLFVDGETFECAGQVAGLAQTLSVADEVMLSEASDGAIDLLVALANMGSIAFAGDEDDD